MMKRKTLFGMLAGAMMMVGLTACGNTNAALTVEPEVQEVVETVEETVEPVVQETFASLNGCLETEYDGKMYFSCVSTRPEYTHQDTVLYLKSLKVSEADGGYLYEFKFMMDCSNFEDNMFFFNYGFVDTYTGEDYTDKVKQGEFDYTYESDEVESFTYSAWLASDLVDHVDLVFNDVNTDNLEDESFLPHFNWSVENGKTVTFMHLPAVELEFVRAN